MVSNYNNYCCIFELNSHTEKFSVVNFEISSVIHKFIVAMLLQEMLFLYFLKHFLTKYGICYMGQLVGDHSGSEPFQFIVHLAEASYYCSKARHAILAAL